MEEIFNIVDTLGYNKDAIKTMVKRAMDLGFYEELIFTRLL